MLLQIRYSSSCVVSDVLLRELQELVDEDQWRTGPLEVLHGDKVSRSAADGGSSSRDQLMLCELQRT